jgi:hypothetical protein
MKVSARPAESSSENVWMIFDRDRTDGCTAENGPILHGFSAPRSTVRRNQDCYTFEHFASDHDVILIPYYYHYQRVRNGLKEETKWS